MLPKRKKLNISKSPKSGFFKRNLFKNLFKFFLKDLLNRNQLEFNSAMTTLTRLVVFGRYIQSWL